MTSSNFVVKDYYELLALHRVFLEAKFCNDPNDLDVSASPIVATLHRKLIVNLMAMDAEKKGGGAISEWSEWLNLDPSRREWGVAVKRAKSEKLWSGWDMKDKKIYIEDLLSPFNITDEVVELFLNEIDVK